MSNIFKRWVMLYLSCNLCYYLKKNNKMEGEILFVWFLCKYNEVGFGCFFYEGDVCVVFLVMYGRYKDGFLVG